MAKVGSPKGDPPLCACGCGSQVTWRRGKGWNKWAKGHYIRMKGNNPNTGEHIRGDRNPMKRPEVAAKVSGEHAWRNRPENAECAEAYRKRQQARCKEANPQWKGGRIVTGGYVRLRIGTHYVMEHRLIMEEHLGRKLMPGEVVHHRNGNTQDNRVENLQLMKGQSEHCSYHNRQRHGS